MRKIRFAWPLLLISLALAGCGSPYPLSPGLNTGEVPLSGRLPPPPAGGGPLLAGVTGKTSGAVALLVPLTGDLAPVGMALENAAKLAFPAGGDGPALDVRDTGGTAAGAVSAAQAAVAAGDGLILGPLTSGEAHAVAPVALAADVNVLAFTNDSSVGAPGIWALGITPGEQVDRALAAASAEGRTQVAGLLPDTDFGHALGTALQGASAGLGEPPPSLTFYEPGFGGVNEGVKEVADFADRGAGLEAEIKAAKNEDTAAGNEKAAELSRQQIAPPSYNALFIGTFNKGDLETMASFLPFYNVSQPQVQFIGPANWSQLPGLGRVGIYNGAIYAGPDPAAASAFVQKYSTTYGAPPPDIAAVAFDAAAIAHLIATEGGYTSTELTNPSGFAGADGVLQLEQNGGVERGLAVFEATPTGPTISSPAPATLTTPSS